MPWHHRKVLLVFLFLSMPVFNAGAQDIVVSHPFSADELTALPTTKQGGGPGGPQPVTVDSALVADLDNGSTIYDNACSACHGETGQGGQGGGAPLTGKLSLSEVMLVVNDGRNNMPSFDVFTEQQLLDISTYVAEALHQ